MNDTVMTGPAKWYRNLLYVHLASIVNSLLTFLPVPGILTTAVSRIVTVAAIICLLKLQSLSLRYRTAGICRAVMLACVLLGFSGSAVPALIATVFSIVAVYQEYSAHSEATASGDPDLSRRWHGLFGWGIAAAVLVSVGSAVAAVFAYALEMDVSRIQGAVLGILEIPRLAVDGFYFWYLIRTLRLLRQAPETPEDPAKNT